MYSMPTLNFVIAMSCNLLLLVVFFCTNHQGLVLKLLSRLLAIGSSHVEWPRK